MPGVVLAIKGGDKSGKSSLALSAPTPIWYAEFDVGGYERAIHRFRDLETKGDILRNSYFIPQQSIRDRMGVPAVGTVQTARVSFKQTQRLTGVKETWYKFLTDYVEVLEGTTKAPNGQPFQSIIMDSAPMVWDLLCSGYLQEKQERQAPTDKLRESLIQIEYAEPNARLRALIYGARESGKNLILTHQLTEAREDRLNDGKIVSVVTGWKSAGWRHIGKECDVEVLMDTRYIQVPKSSNGEVTTERKLLPVAKVTLCGLALEVTDMEFTAPTWDLLMQTIQVYRG